MPCIRIKTTAEVSAEKEKAIVEALGEYLSLFGKSAQWLMVNIEPGQTIWFGGVNRDKAAYVAMDLVGEAAPEVTLEFTRKTGALLEKVLGIPQDAFYITFHSLPGTSWGWNGQTF